jgi:uncharacterized protein
MTHANPITRETDWQAVSTALDERGHAILPNLISADECNTLVAMYDEDQPFRSRVIMARHGYGQGEYKYFAYNLPPPVQLLRTTLYPPLAQIANNWTRTLHRNIPPAPQTPDPRQNDSSPALAGEEGAQSVRTGKVRARAKESQSPPPGTTYPDTHAAYLAACHAAGQLRPTPLLLRYGPGDYNCLHQDLYGDLVFPLQVAILLSRPGEDFEGGEFVLVEQRPRQQSRAEVVPLTQGDAVIFAVNHRPARGARGPYRVAMRHGVSRLRAGHRHTLGIIFHDAK